MSTIYLDMYPNNKINDLTEELSNRWVFGNKSNVIKY